MPFCARLGVRKCVDLNRSGPKHIKIVNLTKRILQFLKIAAPRGVLFR